MGLKKQILAKTCLCNYQLFIKNVFDFIIEKLQENVNYSRELHNIQEQIQSENKERYFRVNINLTYSLK
jgi:hypothetical protein